MAKTIDFNIVADIYDSYVLADFDIEFYQKLCKGHNKILELMCGTGRVSIPLIKSGFDITCVDYSEKMLEAFKQKLTREHKAKILCQDVTRLNIGEKFSLVMIPFNSITEINDKAKIQEAIKNVFDVLENNGTFLVTLYNPSYRKKQADGQIKTLGKFSTNNGNTLLVSYYNNYDEKTDKVTGTQFYEIHDKNNKLIEKRFLDIAFVLISKQEIIEMCENAGFSLKEIYGDYSFNKFNEDSMFMNCVFCKNI
ncbi:MAG: class I SAM-dependent methyltransferase [Alphaproteobacteria bacterium]|nr:class I SAM-dependent methyltransferase [Alphaproteobacteria bacterium]MCL2504843.1 class I SAM-dependent methyltransferase [Alphaproteobacteria bacterium]